MSVKVYIDDRVLTLVNEHALLDCTGKIYNEDELEERSTIMVTINKRLCFYLFAGLGLIV